MQNNSPNTGQPRKAFFDVVHPGRTPASPTSRPVIVSGRPPVQDTSVTKSAPASNELNLLDAKQKVTLQPSSSSVPAAKVNTATPVPVAIDRPSPPQKTMQQRLRTDTTQAAVGGAAIDHELAKQAQDTDEEEYLPSATKHGHSVLSEVLAIIAIIFLVAVIVNILLDAEIINWPVPHTNFFDY